MINGLVSNLTYIIVVLMLILGGLVLVLTLTTMMYLVINKIYQQMRVSYYFISFVKHKNRFIKWVDDNK